MNHDVELGRIREDLRSVSKQIFSKQHRLEVAAVASAQESPVWSKRLAKVLDLGENQVSSELGEFANLGMLQHLPVENDRRKMYQPLPHPLWDFVREVLERTIRMADPENGEQRVALYWMEILEGAAPQAIPR
jgi:hypothetical protein